MSGAFVRRSRERARLYLLVAAGAALGGVARALLSLAAVSLAAPGFPWGTLAANVVGSFAIGFYATLTAPGGRLFVSAPIRQFVMTGVCGGFTTFSVFSLETFRLAAGEPALAAANVGVSVTAWLGAVWGGHALAARLNKLGGT
jgi:CrcB protein